MAKDYTRQEVLEIVQNEAKERGIPRDDFLRFAYIETGGTFNEQASRGARGAKGLFQFTPDTAAQYGIAGRELDAVVNTDAAARLYLANQRDLTRDHANSGRPYLSGQSTPSGLDMYMAHQQGAGGYHSIQSAIATGSFSRSDTRPNILNNVSPRDVREHTGLTMDQFRHLSDQDMAKTFVKYWDDKYRHISIPEVGLQPLQAGQQTSQKPQDASQTPRKHDETPQATQNTAHWPAPGNHKINVADKPGEGRGEFGTPRGDHTHGGIDIQGKVGDRIEPFRPGTVVAVHHWNGDPKSDRAGNYVVVDHGNGVTSTYMHLDKISVEKGQHVGVDTQIGTMGRTGNTPREGDTHLHFEIKKDGARVDPMPILNGARQLDGAATKTEARTELRQHDKGADVEHLQNRLNALGYTDAAGHKLVPDKDYGNRTREAVEQFQRENGLKPTGVADKETLHLVDKGMTRHAAADGQLQPGEKGPDVRGLQENLIQLKMTGTDGKPLKVDGDYGDNTREAVRKYQQANGLPETGTADRATLEKLGSQVKFEPKVTADGHVVAPVADQAQKTAPTPAAATVDKPAATSADKPPTDASQPQRSVETDKPSIADPKHPDHRLYEQAMANLQQLGPSGGFKSQDELTKAAAAVAADAKASGLNSIDHVAKTNTPNGQTLLVAVEGNPTNPASKNSYVDYTQATTQTVDQSSRMAEAARTQQPATPAPNPQQAPENDQQPKAVAQR